MRCEACGHQQPDPKPVVIEKVKEVEVGEGAAIKRVVLLLGILIMACIIAVLWSDLSKNALIEKAISNPSVKFEHIEYDSQGRQTIKASR